MTTAAELAAKTDCADLKRRLLVLQDKLDMRDNTVFRLNALLETHDLERAERDAQIVALRAELAEARAGIVAPPY
jgi:hypothetical protein